MNLLNSIFMDDYVSEVFSDRSFIIHMLNFERALAGIQADLGIIPRVAAERIEAVIEHFQYDTEALYDDMEKSSIPTIALIKQLRDAVGSEYSSYVHWGATSQDVMDTALSLQLWLLTDALAGELNLIINQLGVMAQSHRHTIMPGRTHSQQALPMTFGFKVVNWIAPLLRHQHRLTELIPRLRVLQFGGAIGTLASLGDEGFKVAEQLAVRLSVYLPLTPWHTQRDNLAEFAGWLSLLTGSLAKMAQDIILMAQSEIAEVMESDDLSRGGSSTMPQKRNPIISEIIVACARQNANLLSSMHHAMIQEHERATGSWQLEWATLPQMLHLTMTAVKKARFLSENMVVNVEQMQANVKASKGLMLAEAIDLALAPHIGRSEAKAIIKVSVPIVLADNRHLVDVVREQVDVDIDWESLKDEANYLGQANAFVDRVLKQLKH